MKRSFIRTTLAVFVIISISCSNRSQRFIEKIRKSADPAKAIDISEMNDTNVTLDYVYTFKKKGTIRYYYHIKIYDNLFVQLKDVNNSMTNVLITEINENELATVFSYVYSAANSDLDRFNANDSIFDHEYHIFTTIKSKSHNSVEFHVEYYNHILHPKINSLIRKLLFILSKKKWEFQLVQ